MSDDNIKQMEEAVRTCKEHAAFAIERIAWCKRVRLGLAWLNVALQLPSMCYSFYRLHYVMALVSVAVCYALVIYSWLSLTKSINNWREFKRDAALYRLKGEELLRQMKSQRGY